MSQPTIAERDAILTAAVNGDTRTVLLLAKHGINPNTADNEGRTPVWLAAWGGHTETVWALVECGADVNTADNTGRTPLSMTIKNEHPETVRTLVECGAEASTADKQSSLLWAVLYGHTLHSQQRLLSRFCVEAPRASTATGVDWQLDSTTTDGSASAVIGKVASGTKSMVKQASLSITNSAKSMLKGKATGKIKLIVFGFNGKERVYDDYINYLDETKSIGLSIIRKLEPFEFWNKVEVMVWENNAYNVKENVKTETQNKYSKAFDDEVREILMKIEEERPMKLMNNHCNYLKVVTHRRGDWRGIGYGRQRDE
jgi:ankyrin repeat protein